MRPSWHRAHRCTVTCLRCHGRNFEFAFRWRDEPSGTEVVVTYESGCEDTATLSHENNTDGLDGHSLFLTYMLLPPQCNLAIRCQSSASCSLDPFGFLAHSSSSFPARCNFSTCRCPLAPSRAAAARVDGVATSTPRAKAVAFVLPNGVAMAAGYPASTSTSF